MANTDFAVKSRDERLERAGYTLDARFIGRQSPVATLADALASSWLAQPCPTPTQTERAGGPETREGARVGASGPRGIPDETGDYV